jgi:hypothetical protein
MLKMLNVILLIRSLHVISGLLIAEELKHNTVIQNFTLLCAVAFELVFSPDAAVNAFCEVLDSNLGLENGYVLPGFVGFSSVIEDKFWDLPSLTCGGLLSCHLPFIFSCLPNLR